MAASHKKSIQKLTSEISALEKELNSEFGALEAKKKQLEKLQSLDQDIHQLKTAVDHPNTIPNAASYPAPYPVAPYPTSYTYGAPTPVYIPAPAYIPPAAEPAPMFYAPPDAIGFTGQGRLGRLNFANALAINFLIICIIGIANLYLIRRDMHFLSTNGWFTIISLALMSGFLLRIFYLRLKDCDIDRTLALIVTGTTLLLLIFLQFAALLIFIVFLFIPGSGTINQYGPPPRRGPIVGAVLLAPLMLIHIFITIELAHIFYYRYFAELFY